MKDILEDKVSDFEQCVKGYFNIIVCRGFWLRN